MNEDFETLATSLALQSPISVNGTDYQIILTRMEEPAGAGGRSVDLFFQAIGGNESHRGKLHLDRQHLTDTKYVVDLIVATLLAIIEGRLPPGAVELL
jgi:hypothetical protein